MDKLEWDSLILFEIRLNLLYNNIGIYKLMKKFKNTPKKFKEEKSII